MSKKHYITRYEVRDAGQGNVLVLVSGHSDYYGILSTAFNQYKFSKDFSDRNGRYDWGTYIYKIDDNNLKKLHILLDLLSRSIYLKDRLSQSFALDHQMRPYYESGGRTDIGELVHLSKPYKKSVTEAHVKSAHELAQKYIEFIVSHPCYVRSDYVVAVPFNGKKDFDLPNFIVEHISGKLDIPNATHYICKHPTNKSMKDIETIDEKRENIRDAFEVTNPEVFKNKEVLLVDDIYDSGETLHGIGTELQRSGAIVRALVATKTYASY